MRFWSKKIHTDIRKVTSKRHTHTYYIEFWWENVVFGVTLSVSFVQTSKRLLFQSIFFFGSVVDFVIAQTFLILSILDFLVWTPFLYTRKGPTKFLYIKCRMNVRNGLFQCTFDSFIQCSVAIKMENVTFFSLTISRANPKMSHVNVLNGVQWQWTDNLKFPLWNFNALLLQWVFVCHPLEH